jgi:hypothetical protein
MRLWRASLHHSNANGSIAFVIEPGTKPRPTYSTLSRCSIIENVAIVTLATSARMTSNNSQPNLFELSTKTGQDHLAMCGRLPCGMCGRLPCGMCGRLPCGKGYLMFCVTGRCGHVFGLLMRHS